MCKISLQNKNEWRYIGIVCLVATAVILPIAIFGIPYGNDLPQHYQFAQTHYESLVKGDVFPSWSAKENYGYGGIGIRFYPPLAYYVLALARIFTGNWFDASWLTFMFWMILGCLGVYFWARWWLSAKESAVAAVFYAVIPYHLSQLYTSSFMYADFAGAAVLPFCFAFLTRTSRREKKVDVLGLAVSYTILILTHLPSTIIGSLCLALYALTLLNKQNPLRQLFKALIGVALGLSASAFYWLPMVSEMKWLNHATEKFSSGHYGYADGFFPTYFFSSEISGTNAVITDVSFAVTLLFLTSAVVYIFYRKLNISETGEVKYIFKTVLPLGLSAFLMITPLSLPIWKILSPLQKIQFPTRWLSVAAMCGAIVAAASVHYLINGNFFRRRRWSYAYIIFASVILLFNCVYIWNPLTFTPLKRDDFESDMLRIPAGESFVCWWSVWSKTDAFEIKKQVIAGERQTDIIEWKPEERTFYVSKGPATTARISTFYYPHWKATINEDPVNIEMDENGVMLILLPDEESTVKIIFQEPMTIIIASIISGVTWLFVFTMFLIFQREGFVPD
jgi:hypothetical protein